MESVISQAAQQRMMLRKLISKLICILTLLSSLYVYAEPTAFTYEGRLVEGRTPANGVYDLTFELYTTDTSGDPVSGLILTNSVTVSNGLFSASLDFGNVFDGTQYWLEMAVRTNGSGAFTTINPRQPITAIPNAIHAESASTFTGAISDNQLPSAIPRLNNSTNNFAGTIVAAGFAGNGSSLSNLPASAITSGTFNSSRLGSGNANSSTFLRGDGTWSAPGSLQVANNLGDVNSKAAAADNVGILHVPNIPNDIEAISNATPRFVNQFFITPNGYFGFSRGTGQGQWGGNLSFLGVCSFGVYPRDHSGNGHLFIVNANPADQDIGSNSVPFNVADNVMTLVNSNLHHFDAVRFFSPTDGERGAVGYGNDLAPIYPKVNYLEDFGNVSGFYFAEGGNLNGGLWRWAAAGGHNGQFVWFKEGSKNDDATNMVFNINHNGVVIARNQAGFGGTPATCAQVDIQSTTRGLLLPRMTKAQRDAISQPVAGLCIYQTDNIPGLRVYNGANWVRYSETAD